MKKYVILFVLLLMQLCSCSSLQKQPGQPSLYRPDDQLIQYTGRIDFSNPEKPRLSGAGAYFKVKFKGTSCTIFLEDQALNNNHNYISVVIDDEYQDRIKVSKDITEYEVAKDLKNGEHTLVVCKATEAQIGYVDFSGLSCEKILPNEKRSKRRIEFIGDSVTCGMGLDMSEIPCDAAQWYDQHNAYLAYGPLAARQLNTDWLLSSVSGIGMTRNWNSPGPTMPEVYDNLFLNKDSSVLWDARRYVPDLVSICLGTNDFSDGDGSYDRGPLDSAKFVEDYIKFIKRIRIRYPDAQICLLTSPMLSGEKSAQLKQNLSEILKYMQENENDNKVHVFVFSGIYVKGCSSHPDKQEHESIAGELLPFFKIVMNWQ